MHSRLSQLKTLAVLSVALGACSEQRITKYEAPTVDAAAMADFTRNGQEAASASSTISEAYAPSKQGGLIMNLIAPPAGYTDAVVNGGFEAGFAGWTRNAIGFGYNGDPTTTWLVGATDTRLYAGGMPHLESLAHDGVNGASATEQGSTLATLYQDVTIVNDGSSRPVNLLFWLRWKNQNGSWVRFSPACTAPFDCQDVVVQLRNPSTNALLTEVWSAFTTGAPMFSGGGDFTTANYQGFSFDISAYKGQTVRLQFENRVCCFFQYLDIDDVQVMVPTNRPPVANAGADQTVEATSPAGASATLNGTASSDPDGDALTYEWTEGATPVASGASPSVNLSLGSHTLTLTVTDPSGATSTDDVDVNVVDTRPPVVSITIDQGSLWPPNHLMVQVGHGSASDIADASPTVAVTVTSNEPINGTGDGDTAPDWNVTQSGSTFSVEARAERAGGGSGRTYTITITATDASGNTGSASFTVTVPKSKGR